MNMPLFNNGSACRDRQWLLPWLGVAIICLFLFQNYVSMVSYIAYSYLYWVKPSIHYVNKGSVQDADQLPVPKLLHQTWKDKNVPEQWRNAQHSCISRHKDYTYKLWTDEDGLDLIKREYPWFLKTYLSYPYQIQRVDAVRYFILHKFGGIYIDLDMGCNTKLDFMRTANFTAPMTYPVGISNDVMASVPNSPYLERAIHKLAFWNRWMFIKYIQVMFGTGPMFLTTQYALSSSKIKESVSVVDPALYGKYDFSGNAAFYHLHGSSWHADDAAFIFWLDIYKYHLIVIGGISVGIIGLIWYRKRQLLTDMSLPQHRACKHI